MTLTIAEMRAAVAAQRGGPQRCPEGHPCGGKNGECRVCASGAVPRHQVRFALESLFDDGEEYLRWQQAELERANAAKRYSGEQGEANAWECDGDCDAGDGCPRSIGDEENEWRAVREGDARNETPGKMLDTHQDYVSRRDAIRHLCQRGVMRLCETEYRAEWTAVPPIEMWEQPARDVPAFAECDRYGVAEQSRNDTMGSPEPRARYLNQRDDVEAFHITHNGVVVQSARRIKQEAEQPLAITRFQPCAVGDVIAATGFPTFTVGRAGTYVVRAVFPSGTHGRFSVTEISPD